LLVVVAAVAVLLYFSEVGLDAVAEAVVEAEAAGVVEVAGLTGVVGEAEGYLWAGG
jgi:hypothetical protein